MKPATVTASATDGIGRLCINFSRED